MVDFLRVDSKFTNVVPFFDVEDAIKADNEVKRLIDLSRSEVAPLTGTFVL